MHPEWNAIRKDGVKEPYLTSIYSDYDEKILIPQLKELALEYELNGAWIDGECWAVVEDYAPHALQAYEESGKEGSFKDFMREGFRRHIANYIEKIKAVAPDFELTSNWAYSHQMPEKPTVPVDYISGDIIPMETYNATKFIPRVIANQHMVWDLMSWSTDFFLHYEKSALQLCIEAVDIIAMGGAYQIYCTQDYKGFMQNETYISTLKEVGEFCRAREEYCHKANIRKEIAVLLTERGYFFERERLFGSGGIHIDSAKGCVVACLENQYSTEILLGYNALEEDISEYKAIIVPELKDIEFEIKEKLLNYARKGGNLVLVGVQTTRLFADKVGLKPKNTMGEDSYAQLVINGKKLTIECAFTEFEEESLHQAYLAVSTNEGLGIKQSIYGGAGGSWPLPRIQFTRKVSGSIVRKYGKGNIAFIPFDLGSQYLNTKTYQMRDFLAEVLENIYEEKAVKTNTHLVEIILSEKEGREFVQLINIGAGKKATEIKSFDEIVPLRKVKVSYLCAQKPKMIKCYPENKALCFDYEQGRVCFELEELEIHTIIEIM